MFVDSFCIRFCKKCTVILAVSNCIGGLRIPEFVCAYVCLADFMWAHFRVYDPVHYRLVQQNVGHTDAVTQVMHIPERNQYVSCSADRSIRIWNAWKMPRPKKTLFSTDKTSTEMTSQTTSNASVSAKKKVNVRYQDFVR